MSQENKTKCRYIIYTQVLFSFLLLRIDVCECEYRCPRRPEEGVGFLELELHYDYWEQDSYPLQEQCALFVYKNILSSIFVIVHIS